MTGKKLMKILRYINIGVALFVIILSVLSFIFVVIEAITQLKFFLIFSPIFMTCFGIAMLAAEFNVKIVLKKLPFLKTILGKALFNIYLASVTYYYFAASNQNVLAWVGALSLFFTGVFYLCVYFGCSKKLEKQTDKDALQIEPETNETPQVQNRQPLM